MALLKNLIQEELTKYLKYMEAEVDPFASILTSKKTNEKQLITAARKANLGPIAIQVGLNMLEANKLIGNKKYRWTIQEIIDQLQEGALISQETRKKYFGHFKDLKKAEIQQLGKTIYKELKDNLEQVKTTKEEMIKSKMPKGVSVFVHELDRKKLSEIKGLLLKGWNYFDTAVEKGGYQGKLNTSNLKKLIETLEKELTKINEDYEIEGLEVTIEKLREILKQGLLWEEPDKEIKTLNDLKTYFAQLEKSRLQQKAMIGQYKKKQPAYKEAKILKSENKEAKELIRNKANELAGGILRGNQDLGSTENIKALNKEAEKLINLKLSTGRTLDQFLSKTEGWEDVVSNLVPELIRQIKERRGKAKV